MSWKIKSNEDSSVTIHSAEVQLVCKDMDTARAIWGLLHEGKVIGKPQTATPIDLPPWLPKPSCPV